MACHTYCNSLSVCTGGDANKCLLHDSWIWFHFLAEGDGLGFYYSAVRMKIFFFIIKEKNNYNKPLGYLPKVEMGNGGVLTVFRSYFSSSK